MKTTDKSQNEKRNMHRVKPTDNMIAYWKNVEKACARRDELLKKIKAAKDVETGLRAELAQIEKRRDETLDVKEAFSLSEKCAELERKISFYADMQRRIDILGEIKAILNEGNNPSIRDAASQEFQDYMEGVYERKRQLMDEAERLFDGIEEHPYNVIYNFYQSLTRGTGWKQEGYKLEKTWDAN